MRIATVFFVVVALLVGAGSGCKKRSEAPASASAQREAHTADGAAASKEKGDAAAAGRRAAGATRAKAALDMHAARSAEVRRAAEFRVRSVEEHEKAARKRIDAKNYRKALDRIEQTLKRMESAGNRGAATR